MLEQEVGWFDKINPHELVTKVTQEVFNVQSAIGEKVASFIFTISMAVSGFAIGYTKGYLLALVCTSLVPLLAFSSMIFAKIVQSLEKKVQSFNTKSGGLAEQAISEIKTVKALSGE